MQSFESDPWLCDACRRDGYQITFGAGLGKQGALYEDSGGTARFYPQFTSLIEVVAWLQKLPS
jgi:hypothetical protein